MTRLGRRQAAVLRVLERGRRLSCVEFVAEGIILRAGAWNVIGTLLDRGLCAVAKRDRKTRKPRQRGWRWVYPAKPRWDECKLRITDAGREALAQWEAQHGNTG